MEKLPYRESISYQFLSIQFSVEWASGRDSYHHHGMGVYVLAKFFRPLGVIASTSQPELERLVDFRTTSLGTMSTLRGRRGRFAAMRSSKRLAARLPISDVPWSTVVRGTARKSE